MNTSTSFETISYSENEKVGLIKINRPTKLNALNSQVLAELKSLLADLNSRPKAELCGIIVTGEGDKAFIAGADIGEMQDMSVDQAKEFGKLGQDVSRLLEEVPFPVIACVNGFALGGGCEMAMACDFIYATRNAVFGQPEVKLGLIPGFGGTQRLPKYVGRGRARELIYTGRNIKADEAVRLGLVLELYDDASSMIDSATNLLKSIGVNSPLAVAVSKKTINEGCDLPTTQGLDVELGMFATIFGSEDKKEGTAAFVEKRKANFTGN